jgi:hypothetical protein
LKAGKVPIGFADLHSNVGVMPLQFRAIPDGLPRNANGFNDEVRIHSTVLASFSAHASSSDTASSGARPRSSNPADGTGRAVAMAVAMGLGRFFYTPVLPEMMAGSRARAIRGGLDRLGQLCRLSARRHSRGLGLGRGHRAQGGAFGAVATALLLLAMGLASDVLVLAGIRFLAGLASAFVMIFTSAIVLSHGLAAASPGSNRVISAVSASASASRR